MAVGGFRSWVVAGQGRVMVVLWWNSGYGGEGLVDLIDGSVKDFWQEI